jgi:predicted acylesterase/phospholipase RssA
LRSYENPNKKDHDPVDIALWEAARATSAASTYFNAQCKDNIEYVDGALQANNPIFEVMQEACDLWDCRGAVMVSIGTGSRPPEPIGENIVELARSISKMLTDASNATSRFFEIHKAMAQQNRLFRFSVTHLGVVRLDEYNMIESIKHQTKAYLNDPITSKELNSCSVRIADLQDIISDVGKGEAKRGTKRTSDLTPDQKGG